MNVSIVWTYKSAKNQEIVLSSENIKASRALVLAKDMERTGRVKELFFIDDTDNKWSKKELEQFEVKIPNKHFYTLEELIQIMITYNIQSFSDQPFFEEWIICEIIIPLNNFIKEIRNSVRNLTNEIEICEKLSEYLFSDISNEKIKRNVESLCHQLAPFWKKIK